MELGARRAKNKRLRSTELAETVQYRGHLSLELVTGCVTDGSGVVVGDGGRALFWVVEMVE